MNYLIWIPTYNEEANVLHVLNELKTLHLDMVVSDANSSDQTVALTQKCKVKVVQRSGHGKGFAVIDGLAYAYEHGYTMLVLIDCDRTYLATDIPKLLKQSSKASMVVGKRDFQQIKFARRTANRVMTAFLNLLYASKVSDMASGLRVLRVASFQNKLTAHSFDIEPQMYCVALSEKMPIIEVPINYAERGGKSKIGLRHFFLALYRMFVERFF